MKQKLFWAMLPFMALSFVSCEDDEPDVGFDQTSQFQEFQAGEIRLGEKINSPVTLRNIQRAADSLAQRNGMVLRSAQQLEATHLYVRFLPKDSAEYELLVGDTLLDPTPYPWDYKLSEGDSYHDPSLSHDAYQWQYTVIPVEHDLEQYNVQYEVLEELYMPDGMFDEESNTSTRSASEEKTYLKALLNESVRQNAPDQMEQTETLRKWTPAATIKAYDDILDTYIPLDGVKVRITTFAFVKKTAITNIYGQVSFDKRNRDVSYSIEWERDNWDIRDGGTQAYYHGPDDTKSAWNLNIGKGTPKSLHISAIHRALLKYYHENIDGLIRPSKALKVSYQEGADPDEEALGSTQSAIVRTWSWIFSAIKIYEKRPSGPICTVSHILSTTLHELAHASHACRMSKDEYDNTSLFVKESWAVAAEWHLSLHEYKRLGANSYKLDSLHSDKAEQFWPYLGRSDIYSPMFIDMIDNFNQKNLYSDYFYIPVDNVVGYTLGMIDKNLTSIRNYNNVESFMLNNIPSGVTINQINEFLKMYKEKWTEK